MHQIIQKFLYGFLLAMSLSAFSEQSLGETPEEDSCAMTEEIPMHTLTESAIAEQLGWVSSHENRCGGYYLELPFRYPDSPNKTIIQISSSKGLTFSQHGTSFSQGKITIIQEGQQIIANKAYLYRDPATGKLSTINLTGNVILRSPNSLIIANQGRYNVKTHSKSLQNIIYRTTIYGKSTVKPPKPTQEELQKPRKVAQLSAFGQAEEFRQDRPKIYEFQSASYSTCPPLTHAWQLKAAHIELNKNTGRGTAKHARILVQRVPILYTPYLSFPLDNRRQTGFLPPIIGTSSQAGFSFAAPFYWNLAPNYDTTITPSYFSKRGLELSDLFRYLTPLSYGQTKISVLPHDRAFAAFQIAQQGIFQSSTNTYDQANLRRLEDASTTRGSFSWQDNTRFNDHWSTNIDYNYVSDDFYLENLSAGVNAVTQNQLLQQAEADYKGQYWNFIGRVQGYQTLHPVGEPTVQSQYTRVPQLVLEGDYPSQMGLDYFVANDLSRFDIRDTPGSPNKFPMGNRLNIQPGISYPFNRPYFYIDPRLQFAFTKYDIGHIDNGTSTNPSRALPIFDIHSGLYFDRNLMIFNRSFRQTLEPQVYYTYVPYRNQNEIPIFDTTVNTLNYDQLFMYNRFSGLDRIADANQISAGITTRFVDQQSGIEKIRVGVGQIFYFENRRVTLCDDPAVCNDVPNLAENRRNRSPLSGVFTYSLNPRWNATATTIWNPYTSKVDNQTVTLQYERDPKRVINLAYTFLRNGDSYTNTPGNPTNNSANNLSQTDLSAAWPVIYDWSAVARWTENWNHNHFQNILYGLQYDSCCWAVRFVTGRAFTNLNSSNNPQYNTQFYIQFALKGLGNLGNDPTSLLSNSIAGYQSNFGQDF